MTLPSKKLASIVLEDEVISIDKYDNDVYFVFSNQSKFGVNIYEFANLVKEYMCDNKIAIIKSGKNAKDGWFAESLLAGVISADTEPEAIIKIAERILNETQD